MLFELKHTGMKFAGCAALCDVTLQLNGPGLVSIVGPNGAGKSTLLGILAGLRPGYTGECLYKGKPMSFWTRPQFAREVAVVPQSVPVEFPFTAEQVVAMGRVPFADSFFESNEDHKAVEAAMIETDTLAYRNRDIRTLSGGERQRVILAAALAQNPQTVMLDEPATYLDIQHQIGIYKLIRRLCANILAIVVTHDLNMARKYSDRVLVLNQGRLVADGDPRSVLTPELLYEVFSVRAQVTPDWIAYES